jgi:hypothetical protein
VNQECVLYLCRATPVRLSFPAANRERACKLITYSSGSTWQCDCACHCSKGHSSFLWKTQKFELLQSRNGWNDCHKTFGYVIKISMWDKGVYIQFRGDAPTYTLSIALAYYFVLLFWFFFLVSQVDTQVEWDEGELTRVSSNDASRATTFFTRIY